MVLKLLKLRSFCLGGSNVELPSIQCSFCFRKNDTSLEPSKYLLYVFKAYSLTNGAHVLGVVYDQSDLEFCLFLFY
jgi:hypothetical protein